MRFRDDIFNSWVFTEMEICNYEAFSEALRADVYRKLLDYIKFCDKGVRTYYKMDTKKNKDKA